MSSCSCVSTVVTGQSIPVCPNCTETADTLSLTPVTGQPTNGSVILQLSNAINGSLLYKSKFSEENVFNDKTIEPFIYFSNQKIDELGVKQNMDLSDFSNRISLFASQYISNESLTTFINDLTQKLLSGSISLNEYNSKLEIGTKQIMEKTYGNDFKNRFNKAYKLLESLGFKNVFPNKPPLIGGCAGTRYGCCPNSTTSKIDQQGSNCSSH